MARVVLLAGGNIGDVKTRLQHAQQRINDRVGAVLRCSHRYESDAWGFAAGTRFSNQAIEVSTDLTPEQVLDAVQAIEADLGRDREAEERERRRTGAPYASRTIDIDLLFYDDLILTTDRLSLPHPLLAEREFALVPLCEIMRTHRHPVSGRTMGELLEELKLKKPCSVE